MYNSCVAFRAAMLMRGDARCAVPARRPRTSRGSSRGSARRIRGAMRCARGPVEAQRRLYSSDTRAAVTVSVTSTPAAPAGHSSVYLYSTVRWIHIMNPVPPHSADPGECGGPPGQPARTRRRPQRYTQARNRECPEVTDLAVVSGELGVKLATTHANVNHNPSHIPHFIANRGCRSVKGSVCSVPIRQSATSQHVNGIAPVAVQ